MASESKLTLAQRFFMVLGSLILAIGCLYWAQKVLVPLALAILLAFILTPLVAALQRRGLPRVPAVILTVLLSGAAFVGLGWIIVHQVSELADRLPEHSQTISGKIKALQGGGEGMLTKFQRLVEDIEREVRQEVPAEPEQPSRPVPVVVQRDLPLGLDAFPTIAGHVVELLASALLVVMLVVFMLIQREDLRDRLIRLVGHGRLTLTTRALDEAASRISGFLVAQLALNAAFGAIFAIALWLIGVPYAFLWGFLTGVLRFVPYIGTWISLVFPLSLSVAIAPGWLKPIELLGVFVVLEILTANVGEPLLFSHRTGTSPVALLVAAAFWTWLWGPIGLVLSTPMTVCLLVLGRYVPQWRFFDVLLGCEPVLDTEVRYYQRLLARDEDEAAELVEEYARTHSAEAAFDEVLLPALALMKRDRERDDLRPGDEEFVCRVTRELIDDLSPEAEDGGENRVIMIGCPAQDEADELALEMFRRVLPHAEAALEVLPAAKLKAEMVSHIRDERPALICIGALPPGSLAQVRYLIKRVQAVTPDVRIVVGRWGEKGDGDLVAERLRNLGASYVGTDLRQTRDHVLPLLRVAATPEPGHGRAATAVPAR